MNFYIANAAVLVPAFGHDRDHEAIDIIQKAFPSRRIVGIDCTDIIYGAGTLHCISQQQPAVRDPELAISRWTNRGHPHPKFQYKTCR